MCISFRALLLFFRAAYSPQQNQQKTILKQSQHQQVHDLQQSQNQSKLLPGLPGMTGLLPAEIEPKPTAEMCVMECVLLFIFCDLSVVVGFISKLCL